MTTTVDDGLRSELVILVDDDDNEVGAGVKGDVHAFPGQRHRAFSVVVFDLDGRLLLQRRAASKYHFASRWSNSCCGHPRPGEATVVAAERRLEEEVGLRCRLEEVGSFRYRAEDPASGLVEHEIDHVLVGRTGDVPSGNPSEVDELAFLARDEVGAMLATEPERFTPWFGAVLAVVDERCGWWG